MLSPVLFNDMERNFMVWVGNTGRADGYVEEEECLTPVIYAGNYLAALAALAVFRAAPENTAVPFKEMNEEKTRAYVESYLRLYQQFSADTASEVQ